MDIKFIMPHVLDMSRHLSDYVDIGGECFTVTDTMEQPPQNDSKTYDLVCKSKTEFIKTFRSIVKQYPDTVRLFRAYLPYGEPQLQGLPHSEKDTLKKIIQARMDMLQTSIQSSNQLVKNIQFTRYYDNLAALLKQIDAAVGTVQTITPNAVQRRVHKLTKEKIFHLLLELGWKLMHPEKIEKGTEESWMKLMESVEELTLGRLVESIKNINDPDKFSARINIDRLERATESLTDAASPPDDASELRRRLEAILQLLAVKKYLKKPLPENTKGPIMNNATVKQIGDKLINSMDPVSGGGNASQPISASNIPSKALYGSMAPFYEYFEKRYDPIASILSKATMNSAISLPALAQLLFVSDYIVSHSLYGIHRITHLDPTVLAFIRGQLSAVQAYVADPSTTEDEKTLFIQASSRLPTVSITSLLNKFGVSGHYNDPEKIPVLQFMCVGINLHHQPTKEDMKIENTGDFPRQQIYDATLDFFNEDDLYIVCTSADASRENIPVKVYEIDDESVDVSKRSVSINELKEQYFNQYPNPEIHLERVMDVNSDIIYQHGMLALSMFMASKELLPK